MFSVVKLTWSWFWHFELFYRQQQAEIKTEAKVKVEIEEQAMSTNDDDDDLRRRLEIGFGEQFFFEGRLNAVGSAFYKFVKSPRKYFGDNNMLNDEGLELVASFTPSLRLIDN